MDWVQIATAALVVLLGGGLITAVVAARREARQDPIERQQARDAAAKLDYDRVAALATQLQRQVEVLLGQVQAQDARITLMDDRLSARDRTIAQLERKVAHLEQRDGLWRKWASQLHNDWSILRLEPSPPPLPAAPSSPSERPSP